MLEKGCFCILGCDKLYSMVTIKDDSQILEIVKSKNVMLHELMRNANSYAWAWISWAWIPCYLSMDYLNYRFYFPPLHHASQEFLRLIFSLVFARLVFSDCLGFLNHLHQALFICSLCLHLKKDFLFVQRIAISCKVKSLEILFQKDLNLSLSSSKDFLCLLFWDQIYTRSVSTWVKFKFLFRYSLLTTGLMLHSPFDMCLFE